MKMLSLLFIFLSATLALSQSQFTQPDGSMSPALSSGTSYTLEEDLPLRGSIVVFTHNSTQVARKVAGLPEDKTLTQDPHFLLRANHGWQFWDILHDKICFMSLPRYSPEPTCYADINAADSFLTMSVVDYEASPSLGDSLYYVHSLNRPDLPANVTRTLAQGADSREIGTVHLKNMIGTIP